MTSATLNTDRSLTVVAPFLKQLRRMLEEENPNILRWSNDGLAFEILDIPLMMEYVLPKYFRHGKYSSFQRQLNNFHFRKWTKSKTSICTFSNDYFVRDQPELACRIVRKKSTHHYKPQRTCNGEIPSKSYWNENRMTILAPKSSPKKSSFPSPTDMEVIVKEHDRQLDETLPSNPEPYAFDVLAMPTHNVMEGVDSFDWIDTVLPEVDRIEDDLYPWNETTKARYFYQSSPL